MSHEIETFARRNGTAMPWHGLGGTWNEDASLDDMIQAAGFDWTVESSPLFYRAGNEAMIAKERQLFYRSDRPENVLGIMSDQFKPVQPRELLEFMDRFSNETGAYVDTAFTLKGGAKFAVNADCRETV